MIREPRARYRVLAYMLGLAISAGPASAQATVQESPRDQWQRVPAVIEALGIGPGSRVADVGAGGGYFTVRLAQAVGDEGRVYAADIDESAVGRLQGALGRRGVDNVEVILSDERNPHLPYRTLDAILVVNSYHEFEAHQSMLEAFRRALVPGGRLVLVDNPPRDASESRAAQMRQHRLAMAIAIGDLEDAGFDVYRADPDFIADETATPARRMWLLEARRPLHDPPVQRLRSAPDTPAGAFACGFTASQEALSERASPPDSTELELPGGGRVKVCYSRPSARDREIMGGLVPFGEPWRTGANEATVLRTDVPVRVAGVSLEPGWYSLYTIPGPSEWRIVLNRLADRGGVPIDDWVREHDVDGADVPSTPTGRHVETFTIRAAGMGPGRGALDLEWERTRVRIPVARDPQQ